MELLSAVNIEPFIFTRFALPCLAAMLGGIIVFVAIEYLIRPMMRPKLVAKYDEALHGCRIYGHWYNPPRIHLRLKVWNSRRAVAKSARAFLANVEVEENGQFMPTNYCDVLPLAWHYELLKKETKQNPDPQIEGIPLLKFTPAFVDICTTGPDLKNVILGFTFHLKVYLQLLAPGKTYRLTVQLVAEDTNPVKVSLIISNWNGKWDEIKVNEEPPQRRQKGLFSLLSKFRLLRELLCLYCKESSLKKEPKQRVQ